MSELKAAAGMSHRDIAKSAYKAYAASTGNKNYQGLPMPEFEDLPQKIQTAWEAASRHVIDLHLYGKDLYGHEINSKKVFEWEAKWEGWIPPHVTNP